MIFTNEIKKNPKKHKPQNFTLSLKKIKLKQKVTVIGNCFFVIKIFFFSFDFLKRKGYFLK